MLPVAVDLLRRQCNVLCTFGFVDDAMFSHNGTYIRRVALAVHEDRCTYSTLNISISVPISAQVYCPAENNCLFYVVMHWVSFCIKFAYCMLLSATLVYSSLSRARSPDSVICPDNSCQTKCPLFICTDPMGVRGSGTPQKFGCRVFYGSDPTKISLNWI